MFLGEFHCKADAIGTLVLPEKFRPALDGGLTLTRGIDRCLLIYPAGEWQQLATKIQAHFCLTQPADRAFARLMFAGALICVPDKDGRIPLPQNLRQYADIQAETIVVGLCSHLELWAPQRWAELTAQMAANATAASISAEYQIF